MNSHSPTVLLEGAKEVTNMVFLLARVQFLKKKNP